MNDPLESQFVLVLRAWREPNGIRARILVERFDNSRVEAVTASADEVLEAIRNELELLARSAT